MRCFIAIEIPFAEEFNKYQEQIKDIGGFTFPKEFHLTLKFLGEVTEKDLDEVKNRLRKINFKSFKLNLGKLGVFPNEKHINVIWVDLVPEDKILKLQKDVEDVLENIFGRENREFKAHATLARVKFIKDKNRLSESLKTKIEGEFLIDKFKLIQSELTPKGPIYSVLEEYYGKEM